MTRIRLSWDFYGPRGERTAEHHAAHVASFLAEAGVLAELSVESAGEGHRSAVCTLAAGTSDEVLKQVAVRLRPQRVEEIDE